MVKVNKSTTKLSKTMEISTVSNHRFAYEIKIFWHVLTGHVALTYRTMLQLLTNSYVQMFDAW